MSLRLQCALTTGLLMAALTPAAFSQTPDPTAAQVIERQGSVSVLKDNNPWALEVGDYVAIRQVILTGADGYAVFQLADGSKFEVYPNSRLTFRSTPGNLRDLLDLWLGRVKVHIQKWGGQPNPNRIHTPTAVISVRGTVFDVVIEDDDATTLVAVEEGQVAVQHAIIPVNQPKVLGAGDSLRVYRNVPLAKSGIDKGRLVDRIARGANEAIWVIVNRAPGTRGGVGGGGTPLPGDTPSTPPPPPPPGDPGATPPPPPKQ
ncbi:MAG: FecR family protein [Bryobacteraceae bacterium]|nr:FecR family protein [Bryobacteraceae bacterium]